MTAEEVIDLLGPPHRKPVGAVAYLDVLRAFEAWICARLARAESVRLFIEGGRRPRLVYDPQRDGV